MSIENFHQTSTEATVQISKLRSELLQRAIQPEVLLSTDQAQTVIHKIGIAYVQLIIGGDTGANDPILTDGSIAFLKRVGYVVSKVDRESGEIAQSIGDTILNSPINDIVINSEYDDYFFIPGLGQSIPVTFSDREFWSSRIWPEYDALDRILRVGNKPKPEFMQSLLSQTFTPPERSS